MNQRNHTSTLADVSDSRSQRRPKPYVYASRRGGRQWLRILVSAVLLSSILLSPVDAVPAYALDVPTLIAPANGSTTTADVGDTPPLGIPEFKWAAVPGATSYRLQVSGNIGFTTTIVNITTPNTTYTPTSAGVFPDGVWYWRVRAEAPSPVGEYSNIWSYTKQWATPANSPALISPADSATIDFYDDPVFSWGPVTGAARYKLQIYSSPGGWATLTYTATTLATTHQPKDKLANGTYYWRVVPVDPGNRDGTPSAERSFNTNYNPVLTLLEPDDFATPTFTPTFRWSAVRGVQLYRLEYTTAPSCDFGVAGFTTSIETPNTVYTPTSAFPNDVNYCWRVRAKSGNSISNWSETWEFQKQWYIQAIPLTPVNNYQDTKWPYFSWTPVPGAGYYKIEICASDSFPCSVTGKTAYAVNPYYVWHNAVWSSGTWYWRVTPYHESDTTAGKPSDGNPHPRPVSFVHHYDSLVPHLIYPPYYYPPNNFPSPDEDVATNPHEDRTVALPIFMWHRVFDNTAGHDPVAAYRIQVDDDPLFLPPNWDFDTENLSAAPTSTDNFTPQAGTTYYWRVCDLGGIGGACTSPWSQIWKTRIDTSLVLTPTASITLLRPLNGSEHIEMTPLFEWWPLQGATSYEIQISQDPAFASVLETTSVPYPAYTPQTSYAQRSLNHLDYGTYYWRVRGMNGINPVGTWSAPWRFQLASQSQWRASRTLGAAENQLLVATDPDDVTDNTYELTTLYAAQDKDYWYFGFNFGTGTDMAYGLYFDFDHVDNSGATTDTHGYYVTTIAAHRPEYAIYFFKRSSAFSADQVAIYRWTGTGWDTPQWLSTVGGSLYSAGGYVEIRVPNTAIGMGEDTSSAALNLFSVNESAKTVHDTAPTVTTIAGTTNLDRFTSVSARMNQRTPPTNVSGDPTIFSGVPPFFFDYPLETPWEGFNLVVALDPFFTTPKRNYSLTANTPYLSPPMYVEDTKVQDIDGDNYYFWRVRPQYYYSSANIAGAWSQGWRFERQGFIPQNLQTSVTFATPTFSWDRVEGAESYDLQVDDDPSFNSTAINVNTRQNSYTDIHTLANATYSWRVRVRRNGSVINDWTSAQTFILTLPPPTGLTPPSDTIVGRAPTLCWTPLIVAPTGGDPVLAAWKYRLQVSKEPTFSSIFDNIDTEQSCWTPTKGYDDGQYYWRAAMLDGEGKLGDYSDYQTFTKQYPMTTLVSPTSGANLASTPTFVWTPVNGAARYRLEVSLFPTFSPTYESVTTDNTRYTPTKLYASGRTYYWRVAIVDSDGKLGPFVGATLILDTNPYRIYLPLIKK